MTKNKLDIACRMKQYEQNFYYTLSKRIPVIIRIDGRAFHSFTRKNFGIFYSEEFRNLMTQTMKYVADEIQGCNFAYCQSDEISFLLTDYKTIKTQSWFNYEIVKMVSISASLAGSFLTNKIGQLLSFDSRCFSIPYDEVCNYMIWRQIDALRNSIQIAGREHFSHKQLLNKNCNEIQEMLFQHKKINFNNYPVYRKRGFCYMNGVIDNNIPIFSKDRNYVEQFVYVKED